MEGFIIKGGRKLRLGHTSGTCAAAAATAAASMLLTGEMIPEVRLSHPMGEKEWFEIHPIHRSKGVVSCAVVKNGGNEPNAKSDVRIYAEVKKVKSHIIEIDGGEGIGRAMIDGLQIPWGQAAIHPASRKMIRENLLALCDRLRYPGGLRVVISVPGGEGMANEALNRRMGIEGGISILGAGGMCDPVGPTAAREMIKAAMNRQKEADPARILLCAGDPVDISPAGIPISNYIGDALNFANQKGFRRILLVGPVGRLIKVAGGMMNTHPSQGDCRMELLASYAARCGASGDVIRQMLQAGTTGEALTALRQTGCYSQVKLACAHAIQQQVKNRLGALAEAQIMAFSEDGAHVIQTEGAAWMLREFGEKQA